MSSTTRGLIIITFITLLMILTGCEQKIEVETIEAIDLNNIIKSTSSDFLVMGEPVVVLLHRDHGFDANPGKKVKDLDFVFQPSVNGRAVWLDDYTINFIPRGDLGRDRDYKCTILPAGRSVADSLVTPVTFSFMVIGQDITRLDYEIEFSKDSERDFKLTGELGLLSEVHLSDLRKASKILYSGKKFDIQWKNTTGSEYTFESDKLKYLDNNKPVEFYLEGDKLQLAYDITRSIDVHKKLTLNVKQAAFINDEPPYIKVEFSNDLALNQDFESLINITDNNQKEFDPAITIDVAGKILRINGNFQFGSMYYLSINQQIQGTNNQNLKQYYSVTLGVEDQKPRLNYLDNGVFLTSANDNNLHFRTMNARIVNYQVTLVYENNLCQYLQEWNFSTTTDRWQMNNISRVGKEIASGTLEIGDTRNVWLQHELNISKLLPANKYGIYVVKLYMNKKDALYRRGESNAYRGSYNNDPDRDYYYRSHCTIIKPVVVSDLAITHKLGEETSLCIVNNILDGKPVNGAKVGIINYQNQTLAEGYTDKDGFFQYTRDGEPFYVTAELNDQQTMLKLASNLWETSKFDVGGISKAPGKLQAYIYTERGVYRPGDEINTCIIMRNSNGSFPEDHPLTIGIYDPHQVKVYDTVLKKSQDGFYHLPFITKSDDPTGSWNLKVEVGENTFNHELRIETIAPERLKLTYYPQAESISADDNSFDITLEARYLFGRPAAGLTVNFEYVVEPMNKKFSQVKWGDYKFSDACRKKQDRITRKKSEAVLNEDGKSTLIWRRPPGSSFGSAGIVTINADVIDKGGRASKESMKLHWEPWQAYTGIYSPSQYISKSKENKVKIVLLDAEGKVVVGQDLQVRVYENDRYWWWEYSSYNNFRQNYKREKSTSLVEEKIILSGYEPVSYTLPDFRGRNILLEVTHLAPNGSGHVSSQLLYTSRRAYGSQQSDADLVDLMSDKAEYYPGDTAHISFPINDKARALVSIEKADKLLDWWWYQSPSGKTQADVKIGINEEMQPGVYASVSMIQGQQNNENDCPLRMYGIIPLKVINQESIQNLELKVAEILRPQEKFSCQLQVEPGVKTQITVAVVDEGLLSLTNFQSPDAWKYFYRKQKLGVSSSDNFNQIIAMENGDIAGKFAIGGGVELFKKRQVEKTEVKRFEPISMFSGILQADKNGKVNVEFMMPDYLGAVRIMAVSASGDKYGSIAKTVTVRKELMLMPTLPRALAPGDKFDIPVEVFSFNDEIKAAQVNISATGPIIITGDSSREVTINDRGEGFVLFEGEMQDDLSPVSVTARVQSGKYEHESIVNIPVRALQPYQLVAERQLVEPGAKSVFNITRDGIKNTENSQMVFSRPGFFEYNKHFKYLVRYPYGCLEQNTSAIFPQLFITSLIDENASNQLLGRIDHNISKGLEKMAKHQIHNGGFSYWRGYTTVNLWTSVYCTHFLVEASEKGYHIPAAMLEKSISYLKKNGLSGINTEDDGLLKIQVYQLYVLARAGKPQISNMNSLWQNSFQQLDNTDRWLLAGAYQAAGQSDTAQLIARDAGSDVNTHKRNYRWNYGSEERDRSIILAIASELGKDEIARKLYMNLTDCLNGNRYYSTQSRAFMLWALASYAEHHPELFSTDPVIGYVLENGQKQTFEIAGNDWTYDLNSCRNIEVKLETGSAPAEFSLLYDRIPTKAVPELTNSSFSLQRRFTDKNSQVVDIANLIQGESYTLQITVTRKELVKVSNLALTQILPSGWEIINERLSGNNSIQKNADYVDIRDDRVMWFFDFRNSGRDNVKRYTVKLRAVTAGEFEMPPTMLEAMYLPDYTVILPGTKTIISR
jgi:alpha-2-macroglobulin